jgi:hypothetical protein
VRSSVPTVATVRAAVSNAAVSEAPAILLTVGAAARLAGGDHCATSGPASDQSCTDHSARSSAAAIQTTRKREYRYPVQYKLPVLKRVELFGDASIRTGTGIFQLGIKARYCTQVVKFSFLRDNQTKKVG